MRLTKNDVNFIFLLAKVYESCEPDEPYITKEVARKQLGLTPEEMRITVEIAQQHDACRSHGVPGNMMISIRPNAIAVAREIESVRAEAAHPDLVAKAWHWARRNRITATLIVIGLFLAFLFGLIEGISGLITFLRT